MAIASTYAPGYIGAPTELTRLPYLREAEYDGICDALADGRLVAIACAVRCTDGTASPARAEIVGALAPESADEYVRLAEERQARERQATAMAEQLHELKAQLQAAREIVGEVMAEKRPQDFNGRIEAALADADYTLTGAIDMTEEL